MKKNSLIIFGSGIISKNIINLLEKRFYHKFEIKLVIQEIMDKHEKKYEYDLKNFTSSKVIKIRKLNSAIINYIKDINFDYLIAANISFIIPNILIKKVNIMALGIHASLLPKNKGFAPLNWSILNGDKYTGVSIFKLNNRIDSGKIIYQKKFKIYKYDNVSSLFKKACNCFNDGFLFFFNNHKKIKLKRQKGKSSFNYKRYPKDSEILEHHKMIDVNNLIKASQPPYPYSYIFFKKKLFVKSFIVLKRKYVKKILVKDKFIYFKTSDGFQLRLIKV